MPSTENLVVAHLGLSAGEVVDKALMYPTRLAGLVSIGASSPAVVVESTLGGVPAPFDSDLLRSFVSVGVLVIY